jgi:hypothetical protein
MKIFPSKSLHAISYTPHYLAYQDLRPEQSNAKNGNKLRINRFVSAVYSITINSIAPNHTKLLFSYFTLREKNRFINAVSTHTPGQTAHVLFDLFHPP